MKTRALALLAAIVVTAPMSGCSSQTTTTTRTVERSADDGHVETQTTVTKTDEDDHDGGPTGILSTTVNAIGFILALPFKIIGGLIEIIF